MKISEMKKEDIKIGANVISDVTGNHGYIKSFHPNSGQWNDWNSQADEVAIQWNGRTNVVPYPYTMLDMVEYVG